MQQGNVGNVKKKGAEGELGMICVQMPVVHVVQRNIKARIADTPLILVNFFLRAQNAKNLHILIIHHQKYDGKVV